MNQRVVQSLKSWKGKDNNNLHDHLCEMLSHIQSDNLNGLQHFQRISEFFKKVKFNSCQPDTQEQIKIKNNRQIQYPQWILKGQELMTKSSKIKQTNQKIIQNFQAQTQMLFQPAGVSFGGAETMKINLALKNLAAKQNCTSIRFWGKILTTCGDYLIIQGRCNKNKQPIVTEDTQKYLTGANYYSYWVSHDSLGDNWYELPLVTPQQIRTSKLIKHIFTGNLSAPIKCYPKFEGQERHFLKAQLVRITHNCEISPKGLYAPLQENNEEIQFGEDFKMPEFGELTNLQSWAHTNPYILNAGRANYYLDNIPEAEREEALAKMQESDPKIDRLKGINEDKPVENYGFEGCWLVRAQGNLQVFNGKDEGASNCYGRVTLKNPNWPGWLTVANMKGFGSIYIGYGYKLTQKCFFPMSPQDLDIEGQDIQQFGEPNPKDPPDELEPDSDDENKKPDQ